VLLQLITKTREMNIQKRLQIEFEFVGEEQISGNTALKIVNDVFKEAQELAEQAIYEHTSSTKWQEVKYMKWTTSEMQDVIAKALVKNLSLSGVVKSLPQDNYCNVCNLPTDGEKCYSKRCPV
jgi:YesN/AraC family two-component response regulator